MTACWSSQMYRQLFFLTTIAAFLVAAIEVNETETADGSTSVLTSETSPIAEELSDTTTADNVTSTTPLQVVETTSTTEQLPQGTSSSTLVGELTTSEEEETTLVGSENTTDVVTDEVNATTPGTTTSSPMNCTDIVNPKTGRSDCRRRKNLCTRTGFVEFMKNACPLTCGYCKMCFDEFAKNGQGFCTQANVLRMCEHGNLRTRAATRNRCPVACGVCVPGTVLNLK